MSLIILPLLLLSFGGRTQGEKSQPIAYYLRHPQEQFCSAGVVVKAKVLPSNYSEDDGNGKIRVYDLKILQIFKGERVLESQTHNGEGTSSWNTSLAVKARADNVILKGDNKTEYLLTGRKIKNGKIHLNEGSWIEEWTKITPAYRQGINGIYGQNCKCLITPCFSERPCGRPLKGCDVSQRQLRYFYKSCKWRHSHCLKNREENACSWNESADYLNCMNQLP